MFTQRSVDFLAENRIMDSRSWYAEHKDEFRRVVFDPLAELVCGLAPTVGGIDPLIVTEPKTDRTISRVYRDTRFSNDKMLYRDEMWISLKRDKRRFPLFPEFFFVIGPYGSCWGCGYYEMKPESLENLRRLILMRDPVFLEAFGASSGLEGVTLWGQKYKRTRYPGQPEEYRDWLDRKSISLVRECRDKDLVFSDRLLPAVAADFLLLEPAYRLFLLAEGEASS